MDTFTFFLIVGLGVLYWYNANQARSHAVGFARRECDRAGVQLLDQSVARVRLSMSRDHTSRWRVWREYRFEYSEDGVNRHEGRLVILGYRLLRSALDTSDPIIH